MPITGSIPPIPHIDGCVENGKLSPAFWAWVTGVDKYLKGVAEFGSASYLTEVVPSNLADGFGAAVLDIKYAELAAVDTSSATIPYDDTIPQISEGKEALGIDYTPKSADSQILVRATAMAFPSGGSAAGTIALFRSGQNDAISSRILAAAGNISVALERSIASWGTSQQRVSLRHGPSAATTSTSVGWASQYADNAITSLTIIEYQATPIS